MPKRAVMVSFELWKEWMTQGFMSGGLECIKGLPGDAVLLDLFPRQYGVIGTPELIAVFESASFEPLQEDEYTITAPSGETLPTFTPMFKSHKLEIRYSVVSWREDGHERKIRIRSLEHLPSVLFNWQPEEGEGTSPLVPDPDCKFEVPWLC